MVSLNGAEGENNIDVLSPLIKKDGSLINTDETDTTIELSILKSGNEFLRNKFNQQNKFLLSFLYAVSRSINPIITYSDPSAIWADKKQLRKLLTEIIGNRKFHNKNKVIIKMPVIKEDISTTISVTDDGESIPVNRINDVFLPFRRYSKRETDFGIVLILVKCIAEPHIGPNVKKNNKNGLCVELSIPID